MPLGSAAGKMAALLKRQNSELADAKKENRRRFSKLARVIVLIASHGAVNKVPLCEKTGACGLVRFRAIYISLYARSVTVMFARRLLCPSVFDDNNP
jgi:hypothetical protein